MAEIHTRMQFEKFRKLLISEARGILSNDRTCGRRLDYQSNLLLSVRSRKNTWPYMERRVDHASRKRVAEMSPEEMRRALLVSEKTGLPNRRAFDESAPTKHVAMCDVNGLKALNDQLGYEAGDVLIQRLADSLVRVELDAYHNQGDEFLCKGNSFSDLNHKLAQAQKILQEPFVVRSVDDRITSIMGADFCFGIGMNLKEAEQSLKHQKELTKTLRRQNS